MLNVMKIYGIVEGFDLFVTRQILMLLKKIVDCVIFSVKKKKQNFT